MTLPFRIATTAERAHYERVLYPLQDRILAVAAAYGSELVLTGGTALARCYFAHRYSDDIDLFTMEPQAGLVGRDFANALRASRFDVNVTSESSSFMRALVSDGHDSIQVDVAPDAPRVEKPSQSTAGYFVHTLRDLAANKISAFENRSEAKDAVDLYYLAQQLRWEQMLVDAEVKRIPIAYEDLQHFLDTPLAGLALLTKPISGKQFEQFVITLRSTISEEIKKKVLEERPRLGSIAASLLWDTPPDQRNLNSRTRPLLERRAGRLPLPQRIVLTQALNSED